MKSLNTATIIYKSNNQDKGKLLHFPNSKSMTSTTSPNIKIHNNEPHIPVQPLKTEEYINNAKNYFLTKPERYTGQNIRDYTIFVLGINLARRCGDLLNIKIKDIIDENSSLKSHMIITEQKTNKTAKVLITPVIADALNLYFSTLNNINPSDPLFPSRNKDKLTGLKNPMTVQNFYKKMQSLKAELEIVDPLGTHSMRKTWAYFAVKRNSDRSDIIATVSKALNHSNIETTFRYLGIEQEEIDSISLSNQL